MLKYLTNSQSQVFTEANMFRDMPDYNFVIYTVVTGGLAHQDRFFCLVFL